MTAVDLYAVRTIADKQIVCFSTVMPILGELSLAAAVICEVGALCDWPRPACKSREAADALFEAGLLSTLVSHEPRAGDTQAITSAELLAKTGHDLSKPFERGEFPPEMRMMPARDGIEAQHGLNDVFPGDSVPAQEAGAEPSKQAVEAVAEVFYDSFVYGLSGEKPKWVEGGNSLVQDEARRYAHRALRALAKEGR